MKEFLAKQIVLGTVEFPFTYMELMTKLILPIVVSFIIYKIVVIATNRIVTSSNIKKENSGKVFKWIRRAFRLAYLVVIGLCFNNLFGAQLDEFIVKFYKIVNEPFFKSGKTSISLLTLILILPAFYISSWVGGFVKRGLNHNSLDKLQVDEAKKATASSLIRYIVMVITFLFCLSFIGIDLSSIGVALGVLGVGVGFGLQQMVANFFAGLTLIFARPIKEKDRILIDGYDGEVVSIRLMSTLVQTFGNENIIVPNSKLVNDTIYNFSYDHRNVVISNKVQVSYDSDLDQVIEVLKSISARNPYLMAGEGSIVVRVISFDDSGITMELRTTIKEVTDKYEASSWCNLEIWRTFKKEGVSIPYPHLVLQK